MEQLMPPDLYKCRWIVLTLLIALVSAAGLSGCAGSVDAGSGGSGEGGSGDGGSGQGGGMVTSSSSGGGGSGGTGGTGAMGGAGGAGASGTGTATGGAGGMGTGGAGGMGTGGAGGMGATGGAGGMGGSPPVGTADYPAEVEQNNLKSTANPLAAGTKGFTGWLMPLGDVDVFSVFVTPAGSGLRVELSDGMGGCAAGTAKLTIFGPSGPLAGDIGSCVLLVPPQDAALSNLTEDTHYVQIESATLNPIPFYVVDIQILAAGCGDGLTQAGEQCDDANTMAGDGCSDTCQLEGNYLNEMEPNNMVATRNLLGSAEGFTGAISPIGDQDYFSFDVTVPGSSVTLEVTDGLGGCPSGFDSEITLYDSMAQPLANDDDGGVNACSRIAPSFYPGATNLAPGVYTASVEEFGNNATSPVYVVAIKVSAPGCGDGIVQMGEQCDDNNMTAGDGCSPACQLEGNYLTEMEINDTQALANSVTGYDGATGSISPTGDLDYFSFEVTVPGSSVFLETSDGASGCPVGFDSVLTLFNPMGLTLATDDQGGVDGCSAITPGGYPAASNLAPGIYKVRVEEYGNNAVIPFYVLEVKVAAPGCGDGLLQVGEQCDDGNTTAGDGCSATCQAEAPWEIEPNGTSAQATQLWPGFSYWRGSILPIGDHDYFGFVVPPGGASVTLETHNVGDPLACDFDSEIHLLNQANMLVAESDDEGVDACSLLDPIGFPVLNNLAAGTYYVWVQRYGDSLDIPAYELTLAVQ